MTIESFASRLYGLERMERFDLLPLVSEGTRVKQVSGFDRSGGNDDGFNGTYSALYIDENGEHVIFDEIGAGCIYRFWMTYGHPVFGGPADYDQSILRFYFDDEQTPRLEISIDDFFDGVGAPFEFPLVGRWDKSSHGCYCYVPFPYKERLKITLSGKPYFHNITYHRFDDAEGVVSWTGNKDQSVVMNQWNAVGENPNPSGSLSMTSGSLIIDPGATGRLFRVTDSGVVRSIKLDPGPSNANILTNVWIAMNWEGGEAEVMAPIGDFFGGGFEEVQVSALPLGMKTNGFWYCYFPMPYWESAELTIINSSSESLTLPFEVQVESNGFDRVKSGHFYAAFHERTFVSDGTDFNFINESGRGHVVGVSLRMKATSSSGWRGMTYLEGDERAFIDGELSAGLHGTGNEDYFNSGWYFDQGTFCRPYHGHPWHNHYNEIPPNFTQAYRFHLSDVIPFNNQIQFGVEHGNNNSQPGTYSSVVYYYKQSKDAGMRKVAQLDLGDSWVEGLYDYSTTGLSETNRWGYTLGDETGSDVGYSETNVTFRLPLVKNSGVLLRRRIDIGTGLQKADVYVDDVLVGTWYEPDGNYTNSTRRWIDSEFQIPPEYVQDKDSVTVRLISSHSLDQNSLFQPMNSYQIEAYAVLPLTEVTDMDVDGIPDAWEMEYFTDLNTLSATNDFDGDGLLDIAEYGAGTNPTNDQSGVSIHWNGGVSFESTAGRLYSIEQCTNLVKQGWDPMLNNLLGNGRSITIPRQTNEPTTFFRLKVDVFSE